MTDRLPPLSALRAFDAAARHLSFAKAAEELHVTPAALSQQIKNLEQHLGTQVFRRLNRAVALTDAGRALAPGCHEAFERLSAAWQAALRQTDTPVLSVTAGPAFTAKWLAPRLYDFAQAHPEIELRFAASLRLMDLDRDGIDVAIRYGTGTDAGLHSETLLDDAFLPMMRPDLAERYPTPESLHEATLLADDGAAFLDNPPDWPGWFRAQGLAPQTPALRFSQADHALDAALAGGGVVLSRSSLALPHLSSGALVAPYELALASPARFRFLCRKGDEKRPTVAAFRDWLMGLIDQMVDPCKDKQRVAIADLP